MDASVARWCALASCLLAGATYRTPNFVVTAPTAQVAQRVGQAAEHYRRQLALEWLGYELPQWYRPCPIFVKVGPHLGAGGATSFYFAHGEVFGWRMQVQGPLVRILDSVLPHEVTHTIFASHFRQPLPRWADEGACSTVEHPSERAKQQRMLIRFLQTGRGIPFTRMFRMREYPPDVLPLYAQGHSLCTFLIQQGGRRKFVRYLERGLQTGNWPEATRAFYGYASLSALQDAWLDWVRRGSPPLAPQPERPPAVAKAQSSQQLPRPEPNLILRAQSADPPSSGPVVLAGQLVPVRTTSSKDLHPGKNSSASSEGWRAAKGIARTPAAVSFLPVVRRARPQQAQNSPSKENPASHTFSGSNSGWRAPRRQRQGAAPVRGHWPTGNRVLR